ncbi:MAG: sulfatase-like hydrolase/transferase [Chloroflexi bacterium]|nr:sulfatase-like hydrolase/transferase [Chloroflexota bacterium]
MTTIDILSVLKTRTPPIQNVMIFVSDALRWDCLPESIAAQGVTFKTLTASLLTACSFPSMMTGLHVPVHGVNNFFDRLPRDTKSLMNLDGYNTSLWNENTWLGYDPPESNPLHLLLRQKHRISIDKIEPPFIYLEDEKGGHCPFGWTLGDTDYREWECDKFFHDYGKKSKDELKEKYLQGISRSVSEFEKRMDILRELHLAESTLVIFTADHGELLGEYGGHVGHGEISCSEVVYVPTVFIHPSLPGGVRFDDAGIMRHVDLYPTIMDILGKPIGPVNGISLASTDQLPQIGFNYYETHFKKKIVGITINLGGKEVSVWDKDGGYLFRSGSNIANRLIRIIGKFLLKSGNTSVYLRAYPKCNMLHLAKEYFTALKYYVTEEIVFGSPNFSKKDAKLIITKIGSGERFRIHRATSKFKRKRNI